MYEHAYTVRAGRPAQYRVVDGTEMKMKLSQNIYIHSTCIYTNPIYCIYQHTALGSNETAYSLVNTNLI